MIEFSIVEGMVSLSIYAGKTNGERGGRGFSRMTTIAPCVGCLDAARLGPEQHQSYRRTLMVAELAVAHGVMPPLGAIRVIAVGRL
jgi:hypothetical protein